MMRNLFLILIMMVFSMTLSAQTCVELAWTGGAAGSGAKWVKAEIIERGEIVTINYEWKNGTMTGRVQSDDSLKGTWIQDGSDGGEFQFSVPESGEAIGWWSKKSAPDTKYDMLVKLCE